MSHATTVNYNKQNDAKHDDCPKVSLNLARSPDKPQQFTGAAPDIHMYVCMMYMYVQWAGCATHKRSTKAVTIVPLAVEHR